MPEALIEKQETDRGALCEECEQWEYNEDGSCRTFTVCGVCWNKRSNRSRLEREVVEAAKRDRLSNKLGNGRNADIDAMIKTRNELNAAIDALINFESKPTQETE